MGLLVRREHSARELHRKLRSKGVESDEADTALEDLQRQGFQDDRRYADALVRSRALVGHGPVRVRAELRQNGVPAADIDAALEAADIDWGAVAERAAARFAPKLRAAPAGLDGMKIRQRALAFMLRRGFPQDVARAALAVPVGEDGFGDDSDPAEDPFRDGSQ